MKLIYYHLYIAMSKISNDKLEKPKALSIMAVLIIGNLIAMLKFISFLIFKEKHFTYYRRK